MLATPVLKRRHLSVKRRQLLLCDCVGGGVRLFYVDAERKMELKGTVPWSDEINAELMVTLTLTLTPPMLINAELDAELMLTLTLTSPGAASASQCPAAPTTSRTRRARRRRRSCGCAPCSRCARGSRERAGRRCPGATSQRQRPDARARQ